MGEVEETKDRKWRIEEDKTTKEMIGRVSMDAGKEPAKMQDVVKERDRLMIEVEIERKTSILSGLEETNHRLIGEGVEDQAGDRQHQSMVVFARSSKKLLEN